MTLDRVPQTTTLPFGTLFVCELRYLSMTITMVPLIRRMTLVQSFLVMLMICRKHNDVDAMPRTPTTIAKTTMMRNNNTKTMTRMEKALINEQTSSGAHPFRRLSVTNRSSSSTTSLVDDVILNQVPRGGDLGEYIPAKALAQILAFMALADAIVASLAPMTSLNWMGIEELEKDTKKNNQKFKEAAALSQRLTYHYMHGIGSSAFTVAISLFLMTMTENVNNHNIHLEFALGCGLVTRLFSMTFLFGKIEELGMNELMFGILWTIIAVTCYELFLPGILFQFGLIDPLSLTKVLSLLLGVHGFFLYCDPKTFVHKVPSSSLSSGRRNNSNKESMTVTAEDQMTLDVASLNGGYMAVSGLVTYLLANGVNPFHVAGYASLAYMPVLLKLIGTIKVGKLQAIDGRLSAILVTTLLVSIAVGTLHDE